MGIDNSAVTVSEPRYNHVGRSRQGLRGWTMGDGRISWRQGSSSMPELLLIGTGDWSDLKASLTCAGCDVQTAVPVDQAILQHFEALDPDLLLLEIDSDILLLQHIRRLLRSHLNNRSIPLLALIQRVHLHPAHLVVGVDDFVLPPFAPDEVLARVQMLLWRFQQITMQNRLQSDGLVLDLSRRTVTVDGRKLLMTLREYQLLQFLMTHRLRTFTREALLLQVWGHNFDGDARVVDAYIKRVRSKLGPLYSKRIETLRGVGYRFVE